MKYLFDFKPTGHKKIGFLMFHPKKNPKTGLIRRLRPGMFLCLG
jgi:hypothetical protein